MFSLNSIGQRKKPKKKDNDKLTVIEVKLFTPTRKKYPIFDFQKLKREHGVNLYVE